MSSPPNLLESPSVAVAVLAATPAAVIDAHERLCETNAAFAELTGRAASELIGLPIRKVLRGAARDEGSFGDEPTFRMNTRAGEMWLRMQRTPIGARQVVQMVDVGAEWRALQALAAASAVRDALLLDAEVGEWRYDPDAEVYHIQESITLGYDRTVGTVSLNRLRRIQHPDDIAKDDEIRDRLTAEGGSAEGELRYRDASGGWKTVRVHYRTGKRLASGKYEMYGISQNVSELAQARDAAAIASDRLELAMSAAKAGVWETDMRTGQRWTSEQFREVAGADAMARQESDHFGLYADEELSRVRESWERCLRSGDIEHMDTRLYRKEGHEPWVRIFMHVVHDANGLPLRAIGLMIDIDDQKRQELALIEAKQLAEAATVAKSNFLASMSHEIRTPLNGILGMAQVLVDDQLTDDQRQKIKVIFESGKTLMALLNDVLDISKIEAGRLEISRVDGEIDVTVERMRELFQVSAAERGLSVTLELAEGLPGRMLYDPVRVRQCLGNLLSNAIKFTEHGRVVIRVGAVMQPSGEWLVKISVSDTGIGMDRDTLDRLFTTFTQADASITRRFGGTGLGLAITRQLARLMGGDVTADSRAGEGSTFHLTFLAGASSGGAAAEAVPESRPLQISAKRTETPVAAPDTDAPETDMPDEDVPATRRARGARILLVDDNPVNRQVVKLFLASLDAVFIEAINGREALEKLSRERFDIVLLDVHMPVMDGKETIRQIRNSTEDWRDIPVIALTADAMSGDKERYLGMGMNDYVSKPIDSRELAQKLVALLQGHTSPSDDAGRHAA
ncbi:MAG: response regulator [Alphaproteobacteria bacterium]|nr:response regulator [Alphaproteobacteria bacterium]